MGRRFFSGASGECVAESLMQAKRAVLARGFRAAFEFGRGTDNLTENRSSLKCGHLL